MNRTLSREFYQIRQTKPLEDHPCAVKYLLIQKTAIHCTWLGATAYLSGLYCMTGSPTRIIQQVSFTRDRPSAEPRVRVTRTDTFVKLRPGVSVLIHVVICEILIMPWEILRNNSWLPNWRHPIQKHVPLALSLPWRWFVEIWMHEHTVEPAFRWHRLTKHRTKGSCEVPHRFVKDDNGSAARDRELTYVITKCISTSSYI